MSALAFFIELAKLALVALLVCGALELFPLDIRIKRGAQVLVIMIAVLAAFQVALADPPVLRPMPSLGSTPSIIGPERR